MNLAKLISTKINRRRQSLEEVLSPPTTKVPCTQSTRWTESDSKPEQGSSSSSQALDASSDASWRIEIIMRNAHPSYLEWCGESERLARNDVNQPSLLTSRQDLGSSCGSIDNNNSNDRMFHNHGFLLWEIGRAEWRKQRVDEPAGLTQPFGLNESESRDITSRSRQQASPGRIRLVDLVTAFNYTWDPDSDSF